MSRRLFIARVLVLLCVTSIVLFLKDWNKYWEEPLIESMVLSVPDDFSARFYDRPIVQKLFPGDFYLTLRLLRSGQDFQPGQYSLAGITTRNDLYHKLVQQKSDYSKFRIHDGWCWKQLYRALNKSPGLQKDLSNYSQRAALIDKAGAKSLEGIFAPDTYFYTPGMSQSDVLWLACRQQQKLLKGLNSSSPYLPDQNAILTLASIIQKEGKDLESFKMVSGVFYNRLKKNMRLQSDATVLYLMDVPVRKLSRQDLWIAGAHNTYRFNGLPPFAIAYPSKNAIIAAVYPEPSEYLFFLTDKHGRFIFSKDFKEHVGTKKYM